MAEWSKAPVLKTGDVKASVGSNPTLSAKALYMVLQKYPSGRRGSPAKGVGGLETRARVRLPPSAPNPRSCGVIGGFFCQSYHTESDHLQRLCGYPHRFRTGLVPPPTDGTLLAPCWGSSPGELRKTFRTAASPHSAHYPPQAPASHGGSSADRWALLLRFKYF